MLELKNIKKEYKTGAEVVHALKGVNLAFRENEFVSILGPSGCGKTTLLNIMGGLDQYTSGDLIINGVSTKEYKDANWDAYRNHSIGFVFQSYNLIPHQTVLANVELALTLSGVSSEERRRRAVKALEDVGLGDQLNKKPAQMSGGQMQRVAIARALINDPDILLADEPTGALDSETSLQIMKVLKDISKTRLIIMVTHNPDLAKKYSTRIVKLSDGLVTGDSNPYKPEKKRTTKKDKEALKSPKNKSMSLKTAFQLSLNNLMTKKARTILTAFAGSIGIIGIALILSVSTGFQDYIDKIEEDTLSSYPLTIESTTVDMTSMLAAFSGGMGSDDDDEASSNAKEGYIHEQQIIADSFSSLGKNDLASFKKYVDSKMGKIKPWFNYYEYGYGIQPLIYSTDMKYGVYRICPNTLMDNYMNSLNSNFMTTDVFSKMMDNQELLESQFELEAGRWPTKYNELVLVLQKKGEMMDYFSYSLGLRDPKKYRKMMNKITQGKEVKSHAKAKEWTYEEILGLEFALVRPSDTYRYNSSFDVWEDMSEDQAYMKDLIKDSEKLHITGIVYPKEKSSSTVMITGVHYLPSLTEHIMEEASKTDIVKQQKTHDKIDVFSGKSFESLAEGSDETMGFGNIISVDEDKLAAAFGGGVNPDSVKEMIIDNTMDALKDIDPTEMLKGIGGSAAAHMGGMVQELMSTGAETFDIQSTAIDTALMHNLDSSEHADVINALITAYADELKAKAPISGDMASVSDSLQTTMSDVLQSEATRDKLAAYGEGIALQKTAENVPASIAQVAQDLGSQFNVDPDAIASAFSMNMDEDEMTRLVSAFMSGDEESSYEGNLRELGFAEIEEPTSMTFYLKSFDSKEKFLDFLDGYNEKMKAAGDEDKVISYTDITGTMMSSVKTITNAVSYVLIAFVAISLVVSSIMIGVITYISVLERTKEIGILRAIGASKRDISRIFNAETLLVGLCAGLIGIGSSALLIIPINKILLHLTKIASLKAVLPIAGAIILVFISMLLTYIAGLIPSKMAAKKDPVVALRTE